MSALPDAASCGGTSLVDLLDRIIDKGTVVNGDVLISLAGIELIQLNLRLLLIGVDTALESVRMPGRPG